VSDIFSDLLSEYWDAAYLEGKEGRTHDTKDGRAQHALSKIMAYVKQKDIEIERLRAEVDGLRADAERYRWLTEDHDSKEMRNRCIEILARMPVMSYSAACAAIDAARKGE
jgi:hypothetical protein